MKRSVLEVVEDYNKQQDIIRNKQQGAASNITCGSLYCLVKWRVSCPKNRKVDEAKGLV